MKRLTKKSDYALLLLLIAGIAAGCAKKPDNAKIVAKINDYQLTVDDFMQEAKLNLPSMLLKDTTGAVREQLYNDIVTNELILQQAEKMDLDKNKAFMKEIENYWKQALIKRLINIKSGEYVARVKGENQEIKRQEAQELLSLWVENLKKNAKIKRYDEVLNKIDLSTIIPKDKGGNNEE